MEECAEVQHRISKALRFGLREIQKGQKLTNQQRISYELSDLEAIKEILESMGELPKVNRDLISDKKVKVEKYLRYSREKGILK